MVDCDRSVEKLTRENENLKKALQHFLDQDAPSLCDWCCDRLRPTSEGKLWCPECSITWDPVSGDWIEANGEKSERG